MSKGRDCTRSEPESYEKAYEARREPQEILEIDQGSRKGEEMPGKVRDRFERNEASRRKLTGEVKSTHPSKIVNCRNQVIGGS